MMGNARCKGGMLYSAAASSWASLGWRGLDRDLDGLSHASACNCRPPEVCNSHQGLRYGGGRKLLALLYV